MRQLTAELSWDRSSSPASDRTVACSFFSSSSSAGLSCCNNDSRWKGRERERKREREAWLSNQFVTHFRFFFCLFNIYLFFKLPQGKIQLELQDRLSIYGNVLRIARVFVLQYWRSTKIWNVIRFTWSSIDSSENQFCLSLGLLLISESAFHEHFQFVIVTN